MALTNSPPAEVDITVSLVVELVAEQHPDLASRPIRFLSEGWDNAQFRLGQDLIVRLPRRQVAAALIEHEQASLPSLAPILPLPIPTPVRVGEPSESFAWPWSICRWIPGQDALLAPVRDSEAAARQLAEFLNALHRPAPSNAPINPVRGVPLADRVERTWNSAAAALSAGVLTDSEYAYLTELWEQALGVAPYDGPALWIHGDLHPGNVTTSTNSKGERLISGIIDWGDVTSGDPACDIGGLWALLNRQRRREALRRLDRDSQTIERARAWAMSIGVMLLTSSADRPEYAALGRCYVDEVLAELDDSHSGH